MTHTIIAWQESIDEAGADEALSAVPDPTVSETGDFIFVPVLSNLLASFAALGSTGVSAYLESPSLRRLQYFNISPVKLALMAEGNESIIAQLNSPIGLDPNEGLRAYSNANPAAAEVHTILALLSDGIPEPVSGEIIHAKATAAATEAVGAWALSELTFNQVLPDGDYEVVGARCETDTNGLAFRFVPIGSFFRPAGFCVNGKDAKDFEPQRNGGLGVWFEFNPRSPPSIEVLAAAAGGTSQTVILDLIKKA